MPPSRFDYVAYDEIAATKQAEAKQLVAGVELFVLSKLPTGRAASLAITKLEEVYMWIGKAIRDEQVQSRSAELQENRTNS